MQTKGIYLGSFDPLTNGHWDVIKRASQIFSSLTVVVAHNPQKQTRFSVEERVAMISAVCKNLKNVAVDQWSGLAVDYARKAKATALIRGVRSCTDFEYERQMAHMNRALCPEVDTILLPAGADVGHLSSTLVKDIHKLQGDISPFVPKEILSFF